ncbi:MAG: hypothetical protein GY925_14495 [Actinomycetia bacterium]|nr:hypothetical protein [Actinomycetes bacterium]
MKLNGKEQAEFLRRVEPTRRLVEDEPGLPSEPRLGYRGVIVEHEEDRSDLPPRFRIAGGDLFGRGLEHRPADEEIEYYLVDPDGPFRRAPEMELGWERLKLDLRSFREWREQMVVEKLKPYLLVEPCTCGPVWEPEWWNHASRQNYNNCYNYGTNYRTDTYAQPGKAAGAMYTSLTCASVKPAAEADALIDAPFVDNACPTEGHLVALVVWPGGDYHWYRKDASGWWSHKMGGTPATSKDNAGNWIVDPRTADRGPYTEFCGFMIVKHGHIKIE